MHKSSFNSQKHYIMLGDESYNQCGNWYKAARKFKDHYCLIKENNGCLALLLSANSHGFH